MNDWKNKDYLDKLIEEPFPYLKFIRESELVRNDICPSIGKEAGQLLYFLIKLLKAKKVLEIGTSIGYSTTWLALGVKDNGGLVDTIELSKRLMKEAKRNLNTLKLDKYVSFYDGFGEEIINSLDKIYDLIFIDSSTKSYYELYEKSIEKLKSGGVIIFEDILFPTMNKRENQQRLMDDFNMKIKEDDRITKCYLNIGDGLLLGLKK